jgi:dTDP-4-amino-4,6-dideoxygalactose transaminase
LKDVGIGTGIHYPIPLHVQKAYKSLGYKAGDFPVTERIAEEIVSLPMFPQLTEEQQVRVVEEIRKFEPISPRKQVEADQMSSADANLTA